MNSDITIYAYTLVKNPFCRGKNSFQYISGSCVTLDNIKYSTFIKDIENRIKEELNNFDNIKLYKQCGVNTFLKLDENKKISDYNIQNKDYIYINIPY